MKGNEWKGLWEAECVCHPGRERESGKKEKGKDREGEVEQGGRRKEEKCYVYVRKEREGHLGEGKERRGKSGREKESLLYEEGKWMNVFVRDAVHKEGKR